MFNQADKRIRVNEKGIMTLLYQVHKNEIYESKPSRHELRLLNEEQRKRLSKFLHEYERHDLILVKCKESFNIEDLFFKKGDYYLVTFVGIVKTYTEVPFILHDLKLINIGKEYGVQVKHDTFRIKTKYLFNLLEFIKTISKNESLEDDEYEYVYFDNISILLNEELKKKFSNQKSIYESPSYVKACSL